METVAVYSRKSRFTGKGESTQNQIELCRAYIASHYGKDTETAVYEDEGFSGKNLNRPDFQRLMQDAAKKKLRAVVVYRLDRISRNIGDFAGLITRLSELGVEFVSIREQFDTTTPMGRAMMYIASVFSQLERETIAERIRDNLQELAKTGRWLGGVPPTGYRSRSVTTVTVEGRQKKSCSLELIPEEAERVMTVYGIFLKTESLTATEACLEEKGILTKNGRPFRRFAIRSMLRNPVYLVADTAAWEYFERVGADVFSPRQAFDGQFGIMAYNRTCQEKGKSTVYLPENRWIIAVGRHPGLIPGKQWVLAQNILARNGKHHKNIPSAL